MCTVPFYKINPSGNMTTLLEGLHFTHEEQLLLSEQVLTQNHIGCEQVGFVDVQKGILHMAGGEFCVNATRALGLVMALQTHCKTPGKAWEGKIHTSGLDTPVKVRVKNPEVDALQRGHDVALHIPLPSSPPMRELAKGIVLVSFPGISHILIDADLYPFSSEHWQENAKLLRKQFDLENLPAVGCIWWNLITSQASQHLLCKVRIHPVVRVTQPFSEHYENACGSGTLALGLWLHKNTQKETFFVNQPGGYLSLELRDDQKHGRVAILGGPVHMVAKGDAFFTPTLK